MSTAETSEQAAAKVAAMEQRKGVQVEPRQEEQQEWWDQYRHELARQQLAEGGANVGANERAVSVAAGAILAVQGLTRRTVPGLLCAGVGGMLLYRGVTGRCGVYEKLGLNTAQPTASESESDAYEHGLAITTSVTINKSPDELYRFWRNFENLPRFMEHLESVTVLDDRKSRWVAKAPRLAGGSATWEAEITRDEPGQLIAWRSLPGASVDTAGQVRFQPGLGDRGTEVHVWMNYVPPGGRLGHWVAALIGHNPKRIVRQELHGFKRIMEIGEILTIHGQPAGTCTGKGKPYTESEWKPLFM